MFMTVFHCNIKETNNNGIYVTLLRLKEFNTDLNHTNKLSRFVLPLIDEILECFSHGIDELGVPLEAGADHMVQLLFELQ